METTTVLTDIINTFEGCSTSHHVHAGLESAEITERLNKLGISFKKDSINQKVNSPTIFLKLL